MKRYEITDASSEIDVKRFYLPLTIQVKCPKCNDTISHDFSDNYLSYPSVNKAETIGVYCSDCDEQFDVKVTLKIAIEVEEN